MNPLIEELLNAKMMVPGLSLLYQNQFVVLLKKSMGTNNWFHLICQHGCRETNTWRVAENLQRRELGLEPLAEAKIVVIYPPLAPHTESNFAAGKKVLNEIEANLGLRPSEMELLDLPKAFPIVGSSKVLVAVPDSRWMYAPPLYSLYLHLIKHTESIGRSNRAGVSSGDAVLGTFVDPAGPRKLLEKGLGRFYSEPRRNYLSEAMGGTPGNTIPSFLSSCGANGWNAPTPSHKLWFPKWYED